MMTLGNWNGPDHNRPDHPGCPCQPDHPDNQEDKWRISITLVAIIFPFTLIFIFHIGRPVHRDSLIFIHIPLPKTQISPLKIIFFPQKLNRNISSSHSCHMALSSFLVATKDDRLVVLRCCEAGLQLHCLTRPGNNWDFSFKMMTSGAFCGFAFVVEGGGLRPPSQLTLPPPALPCLTIVGWHS